MALGRSVERSLIPWAIGDDPGEEDCSGVGYVVPEHEAVGGGRCRNGSGLLLVRENEMQPTDDGHEWGCDGCGQTFLAGRTLHSADELDGEAAEALAATRAINARTRR